MKLKWIGASIDLVGYHRTRDGIGILSELVIPSTVFERRMTSYNILFLFGALGGAF